MGPFSVPFMKAECSESFPAGDRPRKLVLRWRGRAAYYSRGPSIRPGRAVMCEIHYRGHGKFCSLGLPTPLFQDSIKGWQFAVSASLAAAHA